MSNLACFADPREFCERHLGNSVVRRCCHLGNRYVAEMRLPRQATGYIDYVEDKPDGTFVLECIGTGDREQLQVLWDQGIAIMQAGQPPQPEV